MNDDELGRALGTLLTGPELRATADAGPRLRAVARRDRGRQLAVGAVATVAVVLLAIGLVTRLPGAPAAPETAAGSTPGLTLLDEPLTITLADPPEKACALPLKPVCSDPAHYLTVDQVLELRADGPRVVIQVLPEDANTLAELNGRAIRIGTGPRTLVPSVPAPADGRLTVDLGGPGAVTTVIDELGPHRAGPPRTGPGPLEVPFELWAVAATTDSTCRTIAGPDFLQVNRYGRCTVLSSIDRVRIDAADVQLVPPDQTNTMWRVQLEFDAADRPAMLAFTTAHIMKAVGVVIGGVAVGGFPVVQGPISSAIEITTVGDRVTAESVVARLRP